MRSRLSLHALLVSSAAAGGQLIMLVVFAALGREAGPGRLGIVTISMTLAIVISGLVDFGANGLWVRDLASGALEPEDYARRATTKVLVGVVLAGVIISLCLVIPALRPFWGTGVVMVSWILAQTMHVALRADMKNSWLAVSMLSERLVLLALYLVLAAAGVNREFAFFSGYLTGAAVGAWVAFATMDPAKRPFRTPTPIGEAWRGARYFGLGSIMVNLSSADAAIAGAVAGSVTVGYYGAVSRWTQPIMLASNTFTTLLIPIAAREGTIRDVFARVRSALWLPAAGVVLCLVMAVAAEPLVLFIMGPQYAPSAPVLQILALAVALINVNQPAVAVLQARGHDRRVAFLLTMAVTVRLLVLVPLVWAFGAIGIALAFVFGETILLTGTLLFVLSLHRARPH